VSQDFVHMGLHQLGPILCGCRWVLGPQLLTQGFHLYHALVSGFFLQGLTQTLALFLLLPDAPSQLVDLLLQGHACQGGVGRPGCVSSDRRFDCE